ncbi:histidine kinase dimerization/phospho-acceptor domain-containing protein [Ramlibacter sp. Leaf400]|uniref:histidine kinase dimerization/phospho-acceptor domain-containing protein n=1 Tax=Ramlibacter sp. Leaf400 TaxID=1736365 RepID=UPI0009E9AED6|nr:histidine kinase dimerization/phospho-acceptor domain-containing protein [Ramlibacter sp. Leaf400]
MRRRTLARHLLAWTLGALCIVWASFVLVGYKTGEHEADELTDGHLASVAALLLDYGNGEFISGAGMSPPGGAAADLKAHDYQQSMSVVVWDAAGRLLTRRGDAPPPPYPRQEGFDTLQLGDPAMPWRSFSRWNEDRSRLVMVLLSVRERDDLADDIAQQITQPSLWLLPVIALVLGLAIYRGLRPLYELSREILALDIHRSQPLPTAGRHREFDSAVRAINTLVDRYKSALQREQELANEFAHELRTPLTSLSLQARALRGAPPQAMEDGLARIEQDALRAGGVVAHLLALARVSRGEFEQLETELELQELAREVVAALAPVAHQRGHELGVAGGRVAVRGHRGLLEIALRNLVENAVAHTPHGTQVEVQVDGAGRWLQVCDTAAPGAQRPPREGSHLGLGHRVVDKVAQLHGAAFAEVAPPAGFGRSYRLTFPARPAGAAPSPPDSSALEEPGADPLGPHADPHQPGGQPAQHR